MANIAASRFCMVLLAAVTFLSVGCAAAEDDSDSSEEAINRFFDGPVVRTLINKMNAVDSASAAVDDDKSRLVKELSTFGVALSKDQQSKYVQAYGKLPRVVGNERAYLDASRALRDFMTSKEGGEALKANAPKTSSAAEGLFEGYKKLASTPYALSSAKFAAWVMDRRNAGNGVVRAVTQYDWKVEVLTPAVTHGAGEAVAEADGDREGAIAALTDALGPLAYANQDHTEVYAGWTALVATLRQKDMKAFERIEGRVLKLPVVGGFMSVGVLFTVLSVGSDVQNGDVGQETFANLGDAAVQMSRALVSLGDAGRIGRFGGAAASTFTKFVQRITPGLGVLCTTAALREHISKMGSDGSIGAYIGAVGDVIALTGVLAESFGVTAPLGAIITGLGFTLSFLGDIVQDWLAGAAIEAEEKQLLQSAGLSADVSAVLVSANAKHVQVWSDTLKYDAAKLQWLAQHAPSTLTAGWFSGFKVDGFARMVDDLNYADGGFALLQAIPDATTETSGMNGSYDFVSDIGSWSFSGADLRGQWLQAMQRAQVGPQNHVRVFTNAAKYVQAH